MIRQGTTNLNSSCVWIPTSLKEAWELKQLYDSDALFIAGGTLLQTYWAKGLDAPPHLISLEQIKEMQGWGGEQMNGQSVTRFGALTSLDICRRHPDLQKSHSLLLEAAKNIAAPAIRNKATLGGNIANGFGDSIPAFLVLDSTLSIYDGSRFHYTPLWEFIERKETLKNDILTSIYVPEKKNTCIFYQKLGYREAFSPSIVTVSGSLQLNDKKVATSVRLAVSGNNTTPQRLLTCESLLEGRPLTNHQLQKSFQTIKEEFKPVSDVFSSATYKQLATANMIVSELARFVN